MRNNRAFCLMAILCLAGRIATTEAAEPGLVAHWGFDEGKGGLLHDRSGNNNHGKIHGATWVKCGDGYALRFDGTDDYVNCGQGPSLDIRGAISLEAWVCPEGMVKDESGIVGKQFSSYLLTYYTNGNCYWYICEGANNCNASLYPGSWSHMVGTFDGNTMRLYLDGEMVRTRQSKHRAINAGRNLFIGCVLGDASADDPAYTTTAYFKGLIGGVRIYNRPLSQEEVRNRYEREVKTRTLEPVVEFLGVKEGTRHETRDFVLTVAKSGAMQIEVGDDAYVVESSFSYPGEKIGKNMLSREPAGNESRWRPKVKRVPRGTIKVNAQGRYYSLERNVSILRGRIEVEDTLTNVAETPVGIVIRNTVVAPQVFKKLDLAATAENPTIFLSQEQSRLGILVEDNVSRLQLEPLVFSNQSGFEMNHFALDVGKRYTFRWAMYPFSKGADYFTFINRVREDWDVNYTIIGPGSLCSGFSSDFADSRRCAEFLKRNRLKVIALSPWMDYFNPNPRTGGLVTREEYKDILTKARAVIKSVDPTIKIIGMIEAPFVDLPEPLMDKLLKGMPKGSHGGYREFTRAETDLLWKHVDEWARWKDSLVLTPDGRMKYEAYHSGKLPRIALTVRAVLGNGQHKFLMDQARFVIEECGLDGFYVDCFTGAGNQYYGYTYDRWDGLTVDIDPVTGKVTRKYTDLVLAGAEHRKAFIEYGLKHGGMVLTNGHPVAHETQSLHAQHFNEAFSAVDVYATPLGRKPPVNSTICCAQLTSPLALGATTGRYKEKGSREAAKIVVLTAIHYLRHGVLYYHYGNRIPETGPGSGEYGPFNHMFPITPVRLGEGFVIGKERIVTCVSGAFEWPGSGQPKILLFDVNGRAKNHHMKPVRSRGKWVAHIELADWTEIAVVEQ